MRLISVFMTLILTSAATSTLAADPPMRVLSMNVCVDQYLIALADKDQIVALSNYARSPLLSYYAEKAQAYPVSKGSVEEVLALEPDLIIAGSARRQLAMAQIRKRKFAVIEVSPAESYAEIVEQIRVIAKALGHSERGESLISKMENELALISPSIGQGREAAYYQRRGFLTGTGTLMDEIMRRVGFENIAIRLGRTAVSRMPLELIVQAKPDYLIMESDADALPDNGASMLFHPALDKTVPATRHLFLPQALTVCGGPFFPEAVKKLAAQIQR